MKKILLRSKPEQVSIKTPVKTAKMPTIARKIQWRGLTENS